MEHKWTILPIDWKCKGAEMKSFPFFALGLGDDDSSEAYSRYNEKSPNGTVGSKTC